MANSFNQRAPDINLILCISFKNHCFWMAIFCRCLFHFFFILRVKMLLINFSFKNFFVNWFVYYKKSDRSLGLEWYFVIAGEHYMHILQCINILKCTVVKKQIFKHGEDCTLCATGSLTHVYTKTLSFSRNNNNIFPMKFIRNNQWWRH